MMRYGIDTGLGLGLGLGYGYAFYIPSYISYISYTSYTIYNIRLEHGHGYYTIWHYIWTWLYGLSYMVFDIWGMKQDGAGTDSGIGIGIGHTGGHLIQGFWGISRDGDDM
jgi:hypothetical protein